MGYKSEILCSIGGSVLIGGLLIFIYALTFKNPGELIFGAVRYRAEVGTIGGIATVIGAGLLTFGVLLFRRKT